MGLRSVLAGELSQLSWFLSVLMVFRVCYAMLPVVLFLALRPSPLPNTWYLQTLHLHKWVSRLVVLVGLVHGGSYFTYFVQNDKIAKVFKFDNFLGVSALFLMIIMGISSLKPVRRRFYSVFYYIHYPFAWLVIILGCFHARPGVSLLTFWCVAVLLSQILYRVVTSQSTQFEEHRITSSLKVLTLPRALLPDFFYIGSHIRLSRPLISPLAWITPSHPYTIASHPSEDSVRLLVREGSFKLKDQLQYSLSGPFPTVSTALFKAKRVLIFAGGTGLSFGAAVYHGLRINAEVKLVWMTKHKTEVAALELLDIHEASVYVTGRLNATMQGLAGEGTDDYDLELEDLLKENDEIDTFDTEYSTDKEDFLDSTTLSGSSTEPHKGSSPMITIHKGRPDLLNEAQLFLSESDKCGTWIIACGPEGLVTTVGNWAKKYPNVQFHGEKYVM